MSRTRSVALLGALACCATCGLASSGCGGTAAHVSLVPFHRPIPSVSGALGKGEADRRLGNGPAQQAVDDRAYPRAYVANDQVVAAQQAFSSAPPTLSPAALGAARATSAAVSASWQELGPVTPLLPPIVTYTGRATTNSGRITALAIDPHCGQAGHGCRLWVAAAGGGIWRTADALASTITWQPVDRGLTSGAFGSLLIDPNDPSANTLYAGSGEPNGSGDSEAGVGLFKSTDGGGTWTLLGASVPVSAERSIGTIAIDPTNPRRIYIGTDLARHGSSSVNGGRFTPPGAPPLGLYESLDGGESWQLAFSKPAISKPSRTGEDWFIGGVNKVELDPRDPATVYAAVQGYGIWRQSQRLDRDAQFHPVFETLNPADSKNASRPPDIFGDRTEFDLTTLADRSGPHTRMYVGDSTNETALSEVWRTDNADLPAASLVDGATQENLAPWRLLSSADPSQPGFASYGFCEEQCDYDIFVNADPHDPNTVLIGGSMNYAELPLPGGPATPSNGRAVLRSTDAGAHWTDMTNDSSSPPEGMHPDQHAIAFDPANPAIFFVGSDGGLIASNGRFQDRRRDCTARALSGSALSLCQQVLAAIPDRLRSLNDHLADLQFQSVSLNPADPRDDLLGGTQDNGTWAFTGGPTWTEAVGGDGGQSASDPGAGTRLHTYFGPTTDVNFNGTNPNTWDYVSQPMDAANAAGAESFSFYVPMIADPRIAGTAYTAGEYVWRTTDDGGRQPELDAHCRETQTSAGDGTIVCGDWRHISARLSPSASDFIVALARTSADTTTMWAGLRHGEVFVTHGLGALPRTLFAKVSTPSTPRRFVSGIAIDPADPNHAWISFSGYGAYTPKTPGHVFEVHFDPKTRASSWTDLSYNLGDLPVTGIARDGATSDLYASTDFGVLRLASGSAQWTQAAAGLPFVAVFGITLDAGTRSLYAATHGRGVWRLALPAAGAAASG